MSSHASESWNRQGLTRQKVHLVIHGDVKPGGSVQQVAPLLTGLTHCGHVQ